VGAAHVPTDSSTGSSTQSAGAPGGGAGGSGSGRGPHPGVAERRAATWFRPDIEGLRAIAVIFVLLYHGGVLTIASGGFIGVDVFFVISGFLITGLLIRELSTHGRISLPRFYARRAKRLLPAAGLVLVVTTVLTWATVSQVQWRTFGGDIVGAALYVVNWVLAGRSVDYLAEDVGVSPVQHFWSLAVEEQFYIVWPLLLVLVGWWVRRRASERVRPAMAVGIAVVVVPSFIVSLLWTNSNAAAAFFVTPTRLWELGLGAMVAIGAGLWQRLPRPVSAVLGWVGLAAVLTSGVFLSTGVAWPGYAALWPVLGSALVIVGGFTSGNAGPAVVLARRPAVWVGGLSYSLYLWHWPLIVAATSLWGELSAGQGALVALLSLLPAWLSYRFVENPFRFAAPVARSNRLALSLGGNFSLTGVAAGLVLMLLVPGANPQAGQAAGAAVLHRTNTQSAQPGSVESLADVEWFTPEAALAPDSVPAAYPQGCQQDQTDAEVIKCEYGKQDADTQIAVVGDSKALQWQSAIEQIAIEQSWHVRSYTKSSCAFNAGMLVNDGEPYTTCATWNKRMLKKLQENKPDVVIVSSGATEALTDPDDPGSASTEAMTKALVKQWSALTEEDIPVVVLLDNPSPEQSIYECVADHPDDLAACTFNRDDGIARSAAPEQQAAADELKQVHTVDMNEFICPTDTCVPVIGNVLIYRQTTHLTDAYVRSLTPDLARRLVPVVNQASQ